jgi:outer membrane protein
MKKWIACLLAVLMSAVLCAAEAKIGFVDSQAVFQNTVKGRAALTRLNDAAQQKRKRLEDMKTEVDKLEKDLINPALNEDTKSKKAYDLQSKRTDMQRAVDDSQRDMQLMSQREFGPIRSELIVVIDKIAKEEGFAMVFDTASSGLAFVDPTSTFNLTLKVAKAYDAQQAAKAPAPKK